MKTKECPECSGSLIKIDQMGWWFLDVATLSTNFALLAIGLVAIGSGTFIYSGSIATTIAIIFGAVCCYYFSKSQASKNNVYECKECKKRFLGDALKPFSYSSYGKDT